MTPKTIELHPQNKEAEIAVIGSMLIDNYIICDVIQILSPDDFYYPENVVVFSAICTIYDRENRVDAVLLREELAKKDNLSMVGGVSYITDAMESVPTAANGESYARIVREYSIRRKLITGATEIHSTAMNSDMSAEDMLDFSEQKIFDIAETKVFQNTLSMKDMIKTAFANITNIRNRKERITGIQTGYYDLDDLTGGLHAGELSILAARPSIGKTTLAMNMMDNISIKNDVPALFFSLEMSSQQVVQNLLCSKARVNSTVFRKGFISEDEARRLHDAGSKMYEKKVYIDDTPSNPILNIRARARRYKAKHDIRLVIVDYLQLVYAKGDSREQQIALISRSLKALARELKIPVLAVAQLNRAVEQRADRRPLLSDLRESGAIEQDADVIMFLTRDMKPEGSDDAKLIVAKQRNGPIGDINLKFVRDYMRFESSLYNDRMD